MSVKGPQNSLYSAKVNPLVPGDDIMFINEKIWKHISEIDFLRNAI